MNLFRTLVAACLCASISFASAQEFKRPRVALVLSGGGARGFAHIGVLRVLREMRVPVDIVVGTSMGSVVGGAFAAGASVPEMEAMVRQIDWDAVVADRPARDELNFRRREDDLYLPSRIEFGVTRDGVALPPSAAGNAALETALNKLLPAGTRDKPVSKLAIPFRSVASDLVTGELVDLVDTPLFLTMRASLAVPGVFAPVHINGRTVVDGGLVRNLPVDLAHAMGADVVIAVNVGTPLAPEKELHSAIGVAQQMLNILTEQNVQRSIKELRPGDILVAPDLNGIGILDFASRDRAMKAGETATRALAARLAPLAMSAGDYAVEENRRLAAPPLADTPLPLASLEVQHQGSISTDVLAAQVGLELGQPVTREDVRKAANTLYGRGDIARVESLVSDDGGKRSVVVKATEADWANSRVRVGLELATDFDDGNSFAIKLMHVKSNLNDWGAELRTIAMVGTDRHLSTQLMQPLGPGSPWYAQGTLAFGTTRADAFENNLRVVRLGYETRSAQLVLGRQLGNWGDIQLGVTRQKVGAHIDIPANANLPITYAFGNSMSLSYRADTLDSLGFPSRGYLVNAEYDRSTGGEDKGLGRSDLVAMRAFSRGDWAGHVYGEWARAQRGTAPANLGGFLRLSGTQPNSVDGRTIAFARFVMAKQIGALPSALGGAVRAGFSVEVGGGYDHELPASSRSFRQAGSLYLSADTRFGPVFFGAGGTKDGGSTLYLFLGPIW